MMKITNEEVCTGCGACEAICPKGAITLSEDIIGFRQPIINQEICINCNLCQKVCLEKIEFNTPKKVFIAKHNNFDIYIKSQSGGAFTAISDYVLSFGGTIYGAAYDDNYEVVHTRAETKEKRDTMRGSKYIQSRMDNVYNEIENDLKNELKVLFVGTGCQVAGVLRFLRKRKVDITKLYTVDILCHGVPSILIWRDYLKYIQNKYSSKISSIYLKEIKECSRPTMNIKVGNHEIEDTLYRKLYYSNLALRKSCYSCMYNKTKRVGDITIGDAWGVEKANPSFNSSRGVSLILINSNKGLELEKVILQNMSIESVDIKDYKQECMISSARPKRKPELFWKDYKNKNFNYILEKYAKHNPLFNIPYIIEIIIKKIRGEKR